MQQTPRFNKRGDPDLTKLPPPIKAAIIQHSPDKKLNLPNVRLFSNYLQQVEAEQARRQRLRDITERAIQKLSPELRELGQYNARKILTLFKENGLEGLQIHAEEIVPMVNSPELRHALIAAFQGMLEDEEMKQLSLQLQSDAYGNFNIDMPLESMFQAAGLNGYFYADGAYDDSQMDWLDNAGMRKSGGTARMAKSKRMGKTRKGKGRKASKDGKKTRRVKCWTRRNKAAQKYVVCSGSRGQKTVRDTNKELEKAFKDLAKLGVKPPFKNLKRTKSKKPEGQLSLEWRKANPVKIDKM